jgi:streptogramin lyase
VNGAVSVQTAANTPAGTYTLNIVGTSGQTTQQGTATLTVTTPQAGALEQAIYIADSGNNRIVRVDNMSGANPVTFGTLGSGVGQFNRPFRVFVDNLNRIYVADMGNHRIVRMDDMTGAGWISLGTFGSGVNQFKEPAGVHVDAQGRIYVADSGNGRIVQTTSMSGGGIWSTYGTKVNAVDQNAPDQFEIPYNVFVNSSGQIYIPDAGADRIVRISGIQGLFWDIYRGSDSGVPGNLGFPTAAIEGSAGDVYIGDQGRRRLLRIGNMSGVDPVVLSTLQGQAELSALDIRRPSNGYIYLAGSGNGQVFRINDMTGAGQVSFGQGFLSQGVSGIFVVPANP